MDRHERTLLLIEDEFKQFFDEYGLGCTNKDVFLFNAIKSSLAFSRMQIDDYKDMIAEKDEIIESYTEMVLGLNEVVDKKETIIQEITTIHYN